MTYLDDCREEDAANADDAMREDITEAVAGRYSFALYLAIHCVGRETYDEWREQNYDVPSCAELVELALVEGPGVEEVHGIVLGIGVPGYQAEKAERVELLAQLTDLADDLADEAQA
jgi:hypothetical protein